MCNVSYLYFKFSSFETFPQVHNAVSQTVEAIENWLQLRPFQLPRGPMLNAYLHFEALSDHCSYDFSCLMCGYFPPLLTLDMDKKGVFELAGAVNFLRDTVCVISFSVYCVVVVEISTIFI